MDDWRRKNEKGWVERVCLVGMDQGVYVCVYVCVCERERGQSIRVYVVCGRTIILDLYEKERS